MQAEHVIANLAAPAQCKLCLALPSQLNSHATCAPARPSHLQEKDEFVENIIADIQRLGLRFEKISYTSDYFPQLKECGERMIKAGGCRAGPAGRACAGPGWRACPRRAAFERAWLSPAPNKCSKLLFASWDHAQHCMCVQAVCLPPGRCPWILREGASSDVRRGLGCPSSCYPCPSVCGMQARHVWAPLKAAGAVRPHPALHCC